MSAIRWERSRPTACVTRVLAALIAGLSTPLALAHGSDGAALRSADPIGDRQAEAQIGADVDTALAAGDAPVPQGGLQDLHGMVRTGTVSGDFSDLPPQSAQFGPEFGFSVALSGEWLVVGAPGTVTTIAGTTGEHGAVFVFRREGGSWIQQQVLTRPGDGAPRCGHSVALRPPHLVFGCPDMRNVSTERGVVHTYRLETDNFVLKNSRYFDADEAHCGRAIALTRNYLAASCPTANNDSGRVYVIKRNTLTDVYSGEAEVQINGSSVSGMDVFGFGEALAMYEPPTVFFGPENVRLAIGAPNTIYPGNIFPRGTVHVYHRAISTPTWNDNALFRPAPSGSDGGTFAEFGRALAMNWNQLVVGAPNNRYGGINTSPGPGSVHRYELFNTSGTVYGWQAREDGGGTNLPDGPHAAMRFGAAVAIAHDNMIAIGAPGTDGEETGGGVADDVGLVEFRRTGGGDWSVFNYYGEARPAPINPLLIRDEGQFGRSLDTDTGSRRLAAGYPRSGGIIGMPGQPNRPRGAVWIYDTDAIFLDGFED